MQRHPGMEIGQGSKKEPLKGHPGWIHKERDVSGPLSSGEFVGGKAKGKPS